MIRLLNSASLGPTSECQLHHCRSAWQGITARTPAPAPPASLKTLLTELPLRIVHCAVSPISKPRGQCLYESDPDASDADSGDEYTYTIINWNGQVNMVTPRAHLDTWTLRSSVDNSHRCSQRDPISRRMSEPSATTHFSARTAASSKPIAFTLAGPASPFSPISPRIPPESAASLDANYTRRLALVPSPLPAMMRRPGAGAALRARERYTHAAREMLFPATSTPPAKTEASSVCSASPCHQQKGSCVCRPRIASALP